MKLKLTKIEKLKSGDYLLTFNGRGFFAKLFNKPAKVYQYIGGSTLWYKYPEFSRCDTHLTFCLANIHAKIKFLNRNEINIDEFIKLD